MSESLNLMRAMTRTTDGYSITLPTDLLERFPTTFRGKLTIHRGEQRSSIEGIVTKYGAALVMQTHNAFALDHTDRDIKLDIQGLATDSTDGDFDALVAEQRRLHPEMMCGGCPRDSQLRKYDEEATICYCVSGGGKGGGV
jgi:hypothetical protein